MDTSGYDNIVLAINRMRGVAASPPKPNLYEGAQQAPPGYFDLDHRARKLQEEQACFHHAFDLSTVSDTRPWLRDGEYYKKYDSEIEPDIEEPIPKPFNPTSVELWYGENREYHINCHDSYYTRCAAKWDCDLHGSKRASCRTFRDGVTAYKLERQNRDVAFIEKSLSDSVYTESGNETPKLNLSWWDTFKLQWHILHGKRRYKPPRQRKLYLIYVYVEAFFKTIWQLIRRT